MKNTSDETCFHAYEVTTSICRNLSTEPREPSGTRPASAAPGVGADAPVVDGVGPGEAELDPLPVAGFETVPCVTSLCLASSLRERFWKQSTSQLYSLPLSKWLFSVGIMRQDTYQTPCRRIAGVVAWQQRGLYQLVHISIK